MNIKIFEKAWVENPSDGTFTITVMPYAKDKINKHVNKVNKLEKKLKMMEISFEQINNSRNDLLRQLANTELRHDELVDIMEQIKTELDKRYHYGVAESLRKILKENVVAEAS